MCSDPKHVCYLGNSIRAFIPSVLSYSSTASQIDISPPQMCQCHWLSLLLIALG